LRNGTQTPRSMSSCSMAVLDLPNCNSLWVWLAKLLLVKVPFESRICNDFLLFFSEKELVGVCDGTCLGIREKGSVFT
jgi:hypothetical protein